MRFKYFLLVILTLTLAACSDPKAPTKSNFKAAINAYLSKFPSDSHCIVVRDDFPLQIKDNDFYRGDIKSLMALASAGLLSAKDITIEEKVLSFTNPNKTAQVKAKEFSLTDQGKKYFREENAGFFGKIGAFCYAKPAVTEIINYTEPADMAGYRISKVDYRYEFSDIASWAKNKEVQEACPQVNKNLEGKKHEAKAVLVLTGNGWVHEKLATL